MAEVQKYIKVIQRRGVSLEGGLFEKIEPLFMIETHMYLEERLRLLQIAAGMPKGFVACEVGSYVGASTCFLSVAAEYRGGRIHCVDTWDNRAMNGEPLCDTFEDFKRNTAPYASMITIHRGESSAVANEIPANLDLLLLDGDHSYEATRADLFAYGPKLKSGGILVMHDFTYDTVQRAAREFFAAHRERKARDLGLVIALKGFQFL